MSNDINPKAIPWLPRLEASRLPVLRVDKVGEYDPRTGTATLQDDTKWMLEPGVGEDILADIKKMAELAAAAPPPPEVRPWCCKDAMVTCAKYILVEGVPGPFFVCEKHLAEIMKLVESP